MRQEGFLYLEIKYLNPNPTHPVHVSSYSGTAFGINWAVHCNLVSRCNLNMVRRASCMEAQEIYASHASYHAKCERAPF